MTRLAAMQKWTIPKTGVFGTKNPKQGSEYWVLDRNNREQTFAVWALINISNYIVLIVPIASHIGIR